MSTALKRHHGPSGQDDPVGKFVTEGKDVKRAAGEGVKNHEVFPVLPVVPQDVAGLFGRLVRRRKKKT